MTQDEASTSASRSDDQVASTGAAGAATVSDVVRHNLSVPQEAARQRSGKAAAQKVVAHPSIEERQRKGRVARAETPHERAGGVAAAGGPGRPGGVAGGSGDLAGAGAGPGAARADGHECASPSTAVRRC